MLRNIGLLMATPTAALAIRKSAMSASVAGPMSLTRSRTVLPKVNKSPADLVSAKFILPFSKDSVLKPDQIGTYAYKPGDYDAVGLMRAMGATGERQEIGLVTDAQASWLAGNAAGNMLAQAEAHGSVPVHATIDGRVIDVLKYPLATYDYRAPGQGWKPYFDITNSPIQPDTAHYPALSYVAFLATDDRYYLEELQFAATFHINGLPPNYAQGKGIIYPWQQRQLAWGLRDVIAAYIATPEGNLPEPLLPKSYWKQILDNNIAALTARYVKSSDPLIQTTGIFRIGNDDIAPWQQDYLSMVLGWAAWTGKVPQIRALYDFQIRQAVIRATGPLRSQAIQYALKTSGASDWPSLLKLNSKAATADGHYDATFVRGVPHYPAFLRGALKVAKMNNVPGASEAFAYADPEAKRLNYIPWRWAI